MSERLLVTLVVVAIALATFIVVAIAVAHGVEARLHSIP